MTVLHSQYLTFLPRTLEALLVEVLFLSLFLKEEVALDFHPIQGTSLRFASIFMCLFLLIFPNSPCLQTLEDATHDI